MTCTDPLPFRISVPGYDSFDSDGILSITIKLEGLLSLLEDRVSLEWSAIKEVDSVSFDGISADVDESPVARCEIPFAHIFDARVVGGWWVPRLVLRARSLRAFEDIPTAQNGVAKLRIRRKDRARAREICAAIANAQQGV